MKRDGSARHRLLVIPMSIVTSFALLAAPAAAKTCGNPAFPGSGYFTSLSVRATPCSSGKAIALAWTACRRENGVGGRCTHEVRRYSCSEKRVSIKTEFDGVVRCKRGGRRVTFTYQQNT